MLMNVIGCLGFYGLLAFAWVVTIPMAKRAEFEIFHKEFIEPVVKQYHNIIIDIRILEEAFDVELLFCLNFQELRVKQCGTAASEYFKIGRDEAKNKLDLACSRMTGFHFSFTAFSQTHLPLWVFAYHELHRVREKLNDLLQDDKSWDFFVELSSGVQIHAIELNKRATDAQWCSLISPLDWHIHDLTKIGNGVSEAMDLLREIGDIGKITRVK